LRKGVGETVWRRLSMKEHPLICRASVVRAILEGRQTQDRRPVKPQPKTEGLSGVYADLYNYGPEWAFWLPDNRMTEDRTWKAPWQAGDHLWVRETWWDIPDPTLKDLREGADTWPNVAYPATDENPLYTEWGWRKRPSIHMPRWASRITLEVTGVRVEKVQDITEKGAKKEGITPFIKSPCEPGDCWTDGKYRTAFEYLWNQIYGWSPNAWERNDWVWVTDFVRLT
jgi:hypothetical protein